MSDGMKRYDNFDDIVFRVRNKEYGAFVLRKKYRRNVIISLLIGVILMSAAILTPYLNAKSLVSRHSHSERQVKIVMQDLDQPHELVAPPPPPPSKARSNAIEQTKYLPPVVADSVIIEDAVQQMPAADETEESPEDGNGLEVVQENREEVQEEEADQEPLLNVQEMPEPRGGEAGMYKFIAENTHYPVIARKNNIQGKVYVRFCITAKGTVEQISILKGVDPELDAEAMRVVKALPSV